MAVFVGRLGVATMATQNAFVTLELSGFPSTAVVTTNTTRLTIDLALLLRGSGDPEDLALARHRARRTFPSEDLIVTRLCSAEVTVTDLLKLPGGDVDRRFHV